VRGRGGECAGPQTDTQLRGHDANTNTQIAEFGYASTFTTTVHIDVGPNNFFSPGVLFRNQPTDFVPGVQSNVFATSWVVTGSMTQVTWFLNGDSVTAKGPVNSGSCAGGSTNTILNGSGPPANTLGNDGDFYIDTTAEVLYGPKAGGIWPTPGVSLIGPPGTNGSTILSGSGAPSNSLGNDGDFYIDTAAEVLYGPKAGGAWPAAGVSLVGPPGVPGQNGTNGTNGNTILSGVGAPSESLGNDGDFYIDTAGHVLYGPKAGGHWPSTGASLVGPTGATGPTGPQGPPGMPVCRNTPATIILCDALFVPGTWTVGPKPLRATDVLSRGRTIYARGAGTMTRSGRLSVRLHKLRRLNRGRYTLTIRLVGHGVNATLRRTVTIR
jgi:hypothetical protein